MHWNDLKYCLAYFGPFSAYLGVALGGPWSFSALILAFAIIPLSELIFRGEDSKSRNQPVVDERRKYHRFFDWLLYFNVPLLYGLIFFFLWRVTYSSLASYEIVGMTLGVGIFIGASGINVAHELGHRNGRIDKWLAKALLLTSLYQHFIIEHNQGHHRYVATLEDPATARYNESLYRFWFRSTWGSLLSAWNIEKKRLQRDSLPVQSWHNQMIVFAFCQFLYLLIIGLVFGVQGVLLAISAAVIGFLLLESINYIEHYGLLRQRNVTGRYEKVTAIHSWNSNHDTGRIFLYELTRHSDHHYKASKKYQLLEHIDESPQLPTGYPGSLILAMVPPLWFSIMNPRVPKHMKSMACGN